MVGHTYVFAVLKINLDSKFDLKDKKYYKKVSSYFARTLVETKRVQPDYYHFICFDVSVTSISM